MVFGEVGFSEVGFGKVGENRTQRLTITWYKPWDRGWMPQYIWRNECETLKTIVKILSNFFLQENFIFYNNVYLDVPQNSLQFLVR